MNRKLIAVVLPVLLAGALGGCSGSEVDAKYTNFSELQTAIESTGIDCNSSDTSLTSIPGGGQAKTCNDSYAIYMFESSADKQAAIDLYAEVQAGILVTPIVLGDDWFVLGSKKKDVESLAKKIGGKATSFTGE